MAEINPPGWLQALSTHTAEQMRSYLGSFLTLPSAAASLKTAGGVHPALGALFAITQNGTPNMSVNVGSGLAFISGTEGTKQGTYFIENDATVNKAVAASDPTNPRIDIVVAKVQDASYSGGTNAWSLAVVTGTPAGSPTPPAAPANSLTLAQIAVAANATSIVTGNITDKRTYAAALGGFVTATSAVRPANPYAGLYAYESDTTRSVRYDGTNWHQLGIHVCTSGTRPSGPFNGMRIYETDTKFEYFWNGTKWIRDSTEIVKFADEARTSTTVLADDADLFASLEINSKYKFRFTLGLLTVGTGVGLKTSITFPAGGRIDFGRTGYAGANLFNDWIQNGTSGGNTGTWSATGSFTIVEFSGMVTTAGTSGNIRLQFAQGISSASSVWVLLGSSLYLKQVA